MRGTEISLVVGGSWSSYRAYIVRYLRQMAVITPYARFALTVGTVRYASKVGEADGAPSSHGNRLPHTAGA